MVVCDVCRNHVHNAPLPAQCADLAGVKPASCPDLLEAAAIAAKLQSPAPVRNANLHRLDSAAMAPRLDCNICLDGCHDPVVTHCGHLFCWPCLYCWLSAHSLSYECPVCRAAVRGKIVPLYGRGEADELHSPKSPSPTSIFFPEMEIPCRPVPIRSSSEPISAAGAADEASINHVMHQRGIYHSRSLDSSLPSPASAALAAYTVTDHIFHHRGVISSHRSRHRSGLQRPAAAGSTLGRMIFCVASFLAWILSRCSKTAPSPSPAAHDHHRAGAANAGGTNPLRRSFSNKKEFVLHWALICVVSVTSVCFICSC